MIAILGGTMFVVTWIGWVTDRGWSQCDRTFDEWEDAVAFAVSMRREQRGTLRLWDSGGSDDPRCWEML